MVSIDLFYFLQSLQDEYTVKINDTVLSCFSIFKMARVYNQKLVNGSKDKKDPWYTTCNLEIMS